ncbi:hypothetical protein MNBD_NITROSPINAE02-1774 [hydrothermal vent metagenome]|uniref:Uncharacterized protein n=1 Tax=hydrothermal vent metagenome TaxID=652676 RepID=A0A3B1CAQ0_9ZZZZ
MPQARPPQDNKKTLLLLTDTLSSRLFFGAGIVSKLIDELGDKLDIAATFPIDSALDYRQWISSDSGINVRSHETLRGDAKYSPKQQLHQFTDRLLSQFIGFFPLAVRMNVLYDFKINRMTRRNSNPFFNLSLGWPFPGSKKIFDWIYKWNFSENRFVDPAISAYLGKDYSTMIISNLQLPIAQNYAHVAHSLGIQLIGHIASWDHPVGKGVVYPYCAKYIVQNRFMKEALTRYHYIESSLIEETGWPQMDLFSSKGPPEEYKSLLASYNLNCDKPVVLIAGNTEKNSPYEIKFLERLIDWWESNGGQERFSIVFRPHPRDIFNPKRISLFKTTFNKPGIYLQKANYSDLNALKALLQNVSSVVTNAGTILLDSIVNGRPVVCVLYDEGAPGESEYAVNNVKGLHYKALMESGAMYLAYNFDEVIEGLAKSLERPEELANQRKAVCKEIVGEVAGGAGARVANSIISCIDNIA